MIVTLTDGDACACVCSGRVAAVSWSFTISGVRHVVALKYSAGSGKRKVLLDGKVVFEEKPPLLSIDKHKKFSLKFKVDGVDCEVTAEKVGPPHASTTAKRRQE